MGKKNVCNGLQRKHLVEVNSSPNTNISLYILNDLKRKGWLLSQGITNQFVLVVVNSAYLIDPQGAFVVLLLLPLSEHQQGNTFLMQFMSNCLQNMELAHLSCGNGLGYHLYSKNVVMFYISV